MAGKRNSKNSRKSAPPPPRDRRPGEEHKDNREDTQSRDVDQDGIPFIDADGLPPRRNQLKYRATVLRISDDLELDRIAEMLNQMGLGDPRCFPIYDSSQVCPYVIHQIDPLADRSCQNFRDRLEYHIDIATKNAINKRDFETRDRETERDLAIARMNSRFDSVHNYMQVELPNTSLRSEETVPHVQTNMAVVQTIPITSAQSGIQVDLQSMSLQSDGLSLMR